jgi:catalase
VARESAEAGYRTFPAEEAGEQLRARPESFADHYSQARLFFQSQTEPEQSHIVAALIFELSKCFLPRVRTAVLARLANVDERLAARVAAGLGLADPVAPAKTAAPVNDMPLSPMLSILAKAVPTLQGRKVGALVSDGTDGDLVAELKAALARAGAVLELVAPTIGGIVTAQGELLAADHKIDGGPSVLFDAVAVLPSAEGGAQLALEAAAVNFVRDAFGHLKVIAYLPTAAPLFVKGGLSDATPDSDAGLIALPARSIGDFIEAAAKGRIWAREPQVRRVF